VLATLTLLPTLTLIRTLALIPALTLIPALAVRRHRAAAPFRLRSRPRAFLGLARADLGDALRVRHLEPFGGTGGVIEVGHGDARQPPPDRALDRAQIPFFLG